MLFPPAQRVFPARPSVVVVGATGSVGEVLLDVLEERHFPIGELRALAGPSPEARTVRFRGSQHPVRLACPAAFEGADLVFFAATGEFSRALAPEAVRRGARVVDKSATWRMHPEVPLVVPEVNGHLVRPETSMVSSPNCTTTGVVMALEPLRRLAGLRRIVVTTLQAASGAGRAGGEELAEQERWRLAGGDGVATKATFPAVLDRNVIPQCGLLAGDGSSSEEQRLLDETRRILGLQDLSLVANCARVPVPVGHSASLVVELLRPIDLERARAALAAFPGVRLVDLPTPADAAGHDEVLVGRVRVLGSGTEVSLWQVADNLRKGAATNAVQIAEAWLSVADKP